MKKIINKIMELPNYVLVTISSIEIAIATIITVINIVLMTRH